MNKREFLGSEICLKTRLDLIFPTLLTSNLKAELRFPSHFIANIFQACRISPFETLVDFESGGNHIKDIRL